MWKRDTALERLFARSRPMSVSVVTGLRRCSGIEASAYGWRPLPPRMYARWLVVTRTGNRSNALVRAWGSQLAPFETI